MGHEPKSVGLHLIIGRTVVLTGDRQGDLGCLGPTTNNNDIFRGRNWTFIIDPQVKREVLVVTGSLIAQINT